MAASAAGYRRIVFKIGGGAARAVVEDNRGARSKSLAVLADLLPRDSSRVVRPFKVVH